MKRSAGSGRKTSALPLRAVAALFLARQHLQRPRQRRFSERNLIAFARDAGGVQMDSINVVDRAHYLTIWSRFGAYDRAALDRIVYERRTLFEYWAHAACLIPTSHFAAWKRAMLDYSTRSRAWGAWLQKNGDMLRAVYDELLARGPLGNADFAGDGHKSGGFWNWKPATHALDYLWMTGRILIHSRAHFRKRFDIAERVLSAEVLEASPLDLESFRRWHLVSSLHAMGAATLADLRMYLTFPRGSLDRRRVLSELIHEGQVIELEVESLGAGRRERWFALATDRDALFEAAARKAASRGTTLLTPFDSLLWYRGRAQRLFGFDYKIQVYTPAAERLHGYYLLPIFHDGQLIGRVDAKLHRAQGILEIKHVHFEGWFAGERAPPMVSWGTLDVAHAIEGIAEALSDLAGFLSAERIELQSVSPSRLRAPLRREIHALK